MNVVHLCHLPLPESHPDYGRLYSHPGRWVLNLALAQKRHTNIHPRLIMQVPGASSDYHCDVEGIPCHFIKIANRFRAATLFELDRRLLSCKALEFTPDLIHAHGTEEAYGLAAQSSRKPYIITAQGLFSQINHVMPPRLISRARVLEFLERRCLCATDHIIAKSNYVADWLKAQYPHLQIHRIPNTFDARLLDIRIPKKEPGSLAFVGNISPRKGLDLLKDALDLDSDLTNSIKSFHVFGNQQPIHAGDYEKALLVALRNRLGDRLKLRGVLPSLEMAKELAHVQYLLAPSREEMFGNQVIEAMLVNTIPIVSSRTAMAENVERLQGGVIFENESVHMLAQALKACLASLPDNICDCRKSVVSMMGPEQVASSHFKLYQSLAKAHTASNWA